MDAQRQDTVTTVPDGGWAKPRIDASRRLIVTGESGAPVPTTAVGLPAALGATTMAASTSVTIATDDARIGIVTETAPATDTASSGLNGRLQRLAQRITSLIAQIPAALGPAAPASSMSVVSATMTAKVVAASQTAAVFGGGSGAVGDFLSHVTFQPTATNAGTTTILDNATVLYTFTTGTLADLKPWTVVFNMKSVSGAWKATTGASISVTGHGNFT